MIERRLNVALWIAGAVTLVLAVAWWWVVYRQVIASALLTMPRALPCLVGSSDLCTLAQALCTSPNHLLGIRHYQATLFWVGTALTAAALAFRHGLPRQLSR